MLKTGSVAQDALLEGYRLRVIKVWLICLVLRI